MSQTKEASDSEKEAEAKEDSDSDARRAMRVTNLLSQNRVVFITTTSVYATRSRWAAACA